jgi:hypothetical protein
VDFLPLAVFAALGAVGIRVAGSPPAGIAICGLVAVSALANLALGIAGPYDDILRYRPAAYVKLAGRFSPNPEYRPIFDPNIEVKLSARFVSEGTGFREPLVTTGRNHYNAFVYAEHGVGTVKVIAQTENGRAEYVMPRSETADVDIRFSYKPAAHRCIVMVDGQQVLTVPASLLVTAPAQVEIGENHSDVGLTYPVFTGKIRTIQRSVW